MRLSVRQLCFFSRLGKRSDDYGVDRRERRQFVVKETLSFLSFLEQKKILSPFSSRELSLTHKAAARDLSSISDRFSRGVGGVEAVACQGSKNVITFSDFSCCCFRNAFLAPVDSLAEERKRSTKDINFASMQGSG